MPLEFKFPDIGEGTDSGELLEWHVTEGQEVREDDPLAEVETDKARVTIPCPTTGRVLELRANIGDRLPVGEVMAVFEPAEPLPAPLAQPAASAPRAIATPSPPTADQIIPLRGVRRMRQRERDPVLRQIAEVLAEALDRRADQLAQREKLLELVENEDRRLRVVLRVPEFEARAMQIRP